jgi:hypothetical protein
VQFKVGDNVVGRGFTPKEETAVARQVRTQETAVAAMSVQQIETELDATTSEMRVLMTKKYQTEF